MMMMNIRAASFRLMPCGLFAFASAFARAPKPLSVVREWVRCERCVFCGFVPLTQRGAARWRSNTNNTHERTTSSSIRERTFHSTTSLVWMGFAGWTGRRTEGCNLIYHKPHRAPHTRHRQTDKHSFIVYSIHIMARLFNLLPNYPGSLSSVYYPYPPSPPLHQH